MYAIRSYYDKDTITIAPIILNADTATKHIKNVIIFLNKFTLMPLE